MTLVARRRVAALVPWLALAAVTAFAIVQMRARHAAEQGVPTVATESATPVDVEVPPATSDVVAAAHAAEAALDAALIDLEAARAEASRLALEGTTASRRAEAAEARLAAHAARVEALELELASLREGAAERPAETPVAALDPVPEAPGKTAALEALHTWVEDAGADEPARRQGAVKRAASATAEQIAGLAALPSRGADPVALARLAAALPTGEATDALVIDLLLREHPDFGVASRVVQALGSRPLLRPAVLDDLLRRASPGVLKVALGLLSGFEAELGDEERRRELASALKPRLNSADPAHLHAGARAAGLLRLPGLAPRLVGILVYEGEVRVSAAHALSLVPDLDTVRAGAVKALPRLLLDPSLSVRTAGALLAEALVGAPLGYDPAAGEAARRDAVDAILDRLN